MSYRLEWIFQYRRLLAKQGELQLLLAPPEQTRLLRLATRLSSEVPDLEDLAPASRLPQPLQAEYVYSGRFHRARVRCATGAGLALESDEAPPPGQHLRLHVWDPSHSTEYVFPVRVIEQIAGPLPGMRVRFEGLPVQSPRASSAIEGSVGR
jgi:hypothetical protein